MSLLRRQGLYLLFVSVALSFGCDDKKFKGDDKKSEPTKPVQEDVTKKPGPGQNPGENPEKNPDSAPDGSLGDNGDEAKDSINGAEDNGKDGIKEIIEEILGITDRDPNKPGGGGGDTPLILDWNRDGKVAIEYGHQLHNFLFDVDADGTLDFLEWVVPVDAILALDRNGNGFIDNGAELFGNHSPDLNGNKAFTNGFLALASFDLNQDNKIDSRDAIFSRLQIWQDKNLNGISEKNELTAISKTDVASISVSYHDKSKNPLSLHPARSHIGQTGTYQTTSGAIHAVYDVYFAVPDRGLHATRFGAANLLR